MICINNPKPLSFQGHSSFPRVTPEPMTTMFTTPSIRDPRSTRRANRVRPCVEAVELRTLMAVAHPIVVATLGDSLTDEYQFYGPLAVENTIALGSLFPLPANINTLGRSSSRNWVENLAQTRSSQATFGAYSTVGLGEVRNQGYAEDWARTGATASGPAADGSGTTFSEQINGLPGQGLPGLVTQTVANSGYSPKDINVVTILIGGNDYVQGLTTYAQSLGQVDVFSGGKSGKPNPINSRIEASIQTAVSEVRRTIPKAKIIVISPPDITVAPVVASALAAGASVFPDLGRTVSGSVAALNSDLARFAGRNRFGLIDFQTLAAKLQKSPTIGGLTVNLKSSGQNITDGFVGDGFHPGSVVQGVLAQAIVNKVDAMYGSKVIRPLTNSDIVNYTFAGSPTVTLSPFTPAGATTHLYAALNAVVSPGSGDNSTPTGTVTFETLNPATSTSPASLGRVLATVPIDGSGMASLTLTPAFPSNASIIAVYSGDRFNDARNSNVLVTNGAGDPIATASSPTSTATLISISKARFNVNLNIAVVPTTPSSGLPSGEVTLNFSRHNPVMVPIVNGTVMVALPVNQYRNQTVQAIYSGGTDFSPSQSVTTLI